MSTIEFLTHDEVCQLTGAKTKAGQIAVLTRNGIRHTIKRNGWPCVIAEALLFTGTRPVKGEKAQWQPRKAL